MKRTRVLLSYMIFLFFFTGIANATYHVSYFSVQHRVYESGKIENTLWIEIQDKNNNYPETATITSLVVTDPNGNVVPSGWGWHYEYSLNGQYNTTTGEWEYNNVPDYFSYFRGSTSATLIPGTYRVEFIDGENEKSEESALFNGIVDVPIISSASYRYFQDLQGNFWWKWDVPDGIDSSMLTRVWINIYDQNNHYLGDLYVKVPNNPGYLFVPKEIYSQVLSRGVTFSIGAQIRTSDNSNKSYSNNIEVRESATRQ